MILETLLTASLETCISLLAEAGIGEELTNLMANWRNADERKRQAALNDAVEKAYQGIRNPEHAETLRSTAAIGQGSTSTLLYRGTFSALQEYDHSYANREGKGTHRAIDQGQR
ncbi:MAG: hypothetical protein AAF702_40455 [Chloroflexota bacterium]